MRIGGLVKDYRPLVTKKGKPMAFFQLEGTDGEAIRVVVFPNSFEDAREKIAGERKVVILDARLEAKEGSVDLICENVMTLDEAPELNAITIDTQADVFANQDVRAELQRILRSYPGDKPVELRVHTADGIEHMRMGDDWRVTIEGGLRTELQQLLGPSAVG